MTHREDWWRRRHGRRHSVVGLSIVLGTALVASACSSSTGSSPAPRTTTTAPSTGGIASSLPGATSSGARTGASPQVEVNPPGDIPDNQAFVPYAAVGYTVSVPEGWARSTQANDVVFGDKYNSITLSTRAVATAPTVSSAQATELPAIRAGATGFAPGAVSSVRRTAGSVVLITYRALSAVNPVTGKVARLAVERYEFWRSGREVVLTLAAPVGSDNVDPWRKVTDSFAWK